MKRHIFLIFLGLILVPAIASATFFERKGEGWFWYHDEQIIQPIEPDLVPEPPPIAVVPPPPPEKEPEVELVVEGHAPLSSAWLEENMMTYLQTAMDNPTQENIRAYLYLQRIAMDRSQRFAEGAQRAVIADPVLDESIRRPLATFGAQTASQSAKREAEDILNTLSDKVGIWLFFKSDCLLSSRQYQVQHHVEKIYGIKTFAISLDGQPMPDGTFPEYVKDQGQSKQLQVLQTPAMFLVNLATKEIVPIGQGNLAVPEMERRMLITATSIGWLSPEDFERTRPMQGPLFASTEDIKSEDIEDPANLIEILRNRLLEGY